jgi:hypothetical protein
MTDDTNDNKTIKDTLEFIWHILQMASGRLASAGHQISTLPHEEKIRQFTSNEAIDTLIEMKFGNQRNFLGNLFSLEVAMRGLAGDLVLASLLIDNRIKELEKDGE